MKLEKGDTVYIFVTQDHITDVGGLIIDNFGNGLLPGQIRKRIVDYDIAAGDMGLPIILQTVNPIAMNAVDYEYIYVKHDGAWKSLTEIHSPDWLEHFKPGDLFERGEF